MEENKVEINLDKSNETVKMIEEIKVVETINVDEVITKLKDSFPGYFVIPPQIDDTRIIVSDKKELSDIIEIYTDSWRCIVKKETNIKILQILMRSHGEIIQVLQSDITSETFTDKEIKTISDLDPIIRNFKQNFKRLYKTN